MGSDFGDKVDKRTKNAIAGQPVLAIKPIITVDKSRLRKKTFLTNMTKNGEEGFEILNMKRHFRQDMRLVKSGKSLVDQVQNG